MVYERVSQAKEQDSRKWIQQKEEAWEIIIDDLSLEVEHDLQRVVTYEETQNIRCL